MTYERRFNLLNAKFKELFFPTLLAAIAGNFSILADTLPDLRDSNVLSLAL